MIFYLSPILKVQFEALDSTVSSFNGFHFFILIIKNSSLFNKSRLENLLLFYCHFLKNSPREYLKIRKFISSNQYPASFLKTAHTFQQAAGQFPFLSLSSPACEE